MATHTQMIHPDQDEISTEVRKCQTAPGYYLRIQYSGASSISIFVDTLQQIQDVTDGLLSGISEVRAEEAEAPIERLREAVADQEGS